MKLKERIFRHICDREACLNTYPTECYFPFSSTVNGLVRQTKEDEKSVKSALNNLLRDKLIQEVSEEYMDIETGKTMRQDGYILTSRGKDSDYYNETFQRELNSWN